jgi:hypothetical protein
MATKKKTYIILALILSVFIIYSFCAAIPCHEEIVLENKWIRSFDTSYPAKAESKTPHDFSIGKRFGYFNDDGIFTINGVRKDKLTISKNLFAEYAAVPENIEVKNIDNETLYKIENVEGYPLFLGEKVFIVHNEQNAISRVNDSGAIEWTYFFTSPVTCVDGADDFIFAGSLDGIIELLDSNGKRLFFFETGGSRVSCIYGVAISRDGSHLAVISGADQQRFLLFERYSNLYRVNYHEFIGEGFRRPVFISFVDNDLRVVYERDAGIGIFEIKQRLSSSVAIEGLLLALDTDGQDGRFFALHHGSGKTNYLSCVEYPGRIILRTPFESVGDYLRRNGKLLFVGSDNAMSAFELQRR